MFPLLANQKSIYDAQTVLAALSGYAKASLDKKLQEILLGDLDIDLSHEDSSEIKTSMLNLLDLLAAENAKDMLMLMDRFGDTLAQYSAHEFMKKPISEIKVDMIVAK